MCPIATIVITWIPNLSGRSLSKSLRNTNRNMHGHWILFPKKIRTGGSGVWGTVNMPAHPSISLNDARTIVNYILNSDQKTIRTLPLTGSFTPKIPEDDNGKGTVIIRAAYTDKSAKGSAPLTTEEVKVLRSQQLSPGTADIIQNAEVTLQMMFAVSRISFQNQMDILDSNKLI